LEVRELLEGLLGRDVEAELGTGAVDPRRHPGAMAGAYVDDTQRLRAAILMDLSLTAYAGSAIALMGTRVAEDVIRSELLSPVLYDNAAEILNVAASLFNAEGAPHVRLAEAFAPREVLPSDLGTAAGANVPRIDLTLTIGGYGSGRMSGLVL
jgi:hypothetical protein